MAEDASPAKERQEAAFAEAARERRRGVVGEFWEFARQNKKWWLTPIIVILLLVGLLLILGSTGAGSLIYPLF